jgi:GT2 family glycosyltransferase
MSSINPANKKIKLSVIIINFNLAREIENCLTSLLKNIKLEEELDYEIIIIDNNSTDNDLPGVERKFKKKNICFYYLDTNLGFGKGCNYGFSKANGEYICFLNPDTIIKENIFPPIIKLFETDTTIGIIGPKQQVRSPFFDFSGGFSPNIFFELFNLFGLGIFVEGFIMSLYTKLKRGEPLKVNWILGASIFISSELFNIINGFDKDYFMFFEELDLCKRVSNKGYKIIYDPRLKIHHIGSVSGKKDYKLYTIRTYSSKYIFISKNFFSLKKYLMKFLLFTQLFSQIIIWTILFPLNKEKSEQKLKAFIYLINHRLRLS